MLIFFSPGINDLPWRWLTNSPGNIVTCKLAGLNLNHMLIEILLIVKLILVVLRILWLVYKVALTSLQSLGRFWMMLKGLAKTRCH